MDISSKLALDTQALEQLRGQARHSPDQALKAAAQQFESVFLNMMLKSMRDATPQDGMFDSEQTRMFTGMLDQQLAQSMSNRGIGLADIMVKQLSHGGSLAQSLSPLQQLKTTPPAESSISGLSNTARPVPATAPVAAPAAALPSAFNGSVQQSFVDKLLPHALAASRASGVPPQLMLGQAALESGWGKREINNADGSNSHNLFGIKAGSSWKGDVAEVMTTEYRNGVAYKQVEKFRAYPSYTAAFNDYANMIANNPRYAGVLQQGDNAAGMAQEIQRSGYATDPNYAAKLTKVMAMLGSVG